MSPSLTSESFKPNITTRTNPPPRTLHLHPSILHSGFYGFNASARYIKPKTTSSALNLSITLDDINRAEGYSANYFKLPRLTINVELREKIAQHARKMASENEFVAGVVLFGSIARGEETEQSDVDLLILWEKLNVDPRKRHVYIYKTVSKYFPQT